MLDVAPAAVVLNAPVVEVNERDERKGPGYGKRARRRFATGDQTHEVRDQDEEEQGCQERNMALVAMADGVFAHVFADELIAVLDHVHELVRRNQGEFLANNHDNEQGDEPRDAHPEDVLGHADATAEIDDERGIERVFKFGHQLVNQR